MARKKEAPSQEEKRSAAEYYKLNVQAVDDLVSANQENSPPVSEAELRRHGARSRIQMADWLKAVLIKTWFAGMVCFFFLWGLGMYVPDQLDQLLIVGLALGFVTDLLVHPIFRFLAKTPGQMDRWMMVPRKGFASLPLNVLYAFLLLFCVVTTYQAINTALVSLSGAQDSVPLGVEPVLFGLFTMGWDMLFLLVKRTGKKIVREAKEKALTSTGKR